MKEKKIYDKRNIWNRQYIKKREGVYTKWENIKKKRYILGEDIYGNGTKREIHRKKRKKKKAIQK